MGIEPKDLLGLSKPAEIVTERGANFLSRLFGKPASELGELMGQEIEFIRLNRRRVLERGDLMVRDAGAEPQRIPLNVLVPLLQAAPLEEDEVLKEAWAALLANAAIEPSDVPPSFVRVLAELTPKEAALFNELQLIPGEESTLRGGRRFGREAILEAWDKLGYSKSGSSPLTLADDKERIDLRDQDMARLNHALINLCRLGLVSEYLYVAPASQFEPTSFPLPRRVNRLYGVSQFGEDFVRACRPPAKAGSGGNAP